MRSQFEPWLARLDHPLVERAMKVARGFNAHRGPVRAASLAFTTLLALVPLLALVLGVSKAIIRTQDSAKLVQWIDRALSAAVPQLQYLSENDANAARGDVIQRIQESIDKIDAGALGIFGSLVLVSVAVSLFSAIEAALNDIWGVLRGRSFAQRVVYYWAGVTLGPLLLFVSLGLTGSVAIDRVLGSMPGGFATAAFWWILPFLTLGVGFTLLYWTMPNTTVPLRAAAIGGFAAGALFQGNNMLSVLYFSRVVGYSAVYGSLGALPVLMLGIYVSWMIVLLGAEISHVAASPPLEEAAVPEAFDARAEIALGVARAATAAFLDGRVGATRDEIAAALDIPAAWVNASLELLCRHGLLTGGDGVSADADPRYLPARPPSAIAALDVVAAVRRGNPEEIVSTGRQPAEVVGFLKSFDAAVTKDLAGVTLEALARKSA
jgi:membrane protein